MNPLRATNTPPSKFVGDMQKAAEHIEAAQRIMASGPLAFYFKKLVEHSTALLEKYAPIKAGQRARIARRIDCKKIGWAGQEKTLAVGQIGKVESVDYSDGKFRFTFVPDKQWYESTETKGDCVE